MKSGVRLFIIYFPILLVACQVGANLLYFINSDVYLLLGFYLNTFFGTNVMFATFLLLFTYSFKFCDVSRWAAIAEVLFSINYLIVQEDDLYNILFQVIIGLIAIGLTFTKYIQKFPNCRIARWVEYYRVAGRFFRAVFMEKNCKKGFERWEREHINKIIQQQGYNHGIPSENRC